MRPPVLVAAAVAVAVLLAGRDNSPGTVVGKHSTMLAGTWHHFLSVRHDQSGHTTDEDVPAVDFLACGVGDRYPECTR